MDVAALEIHDLQKSFRRRQVLQSIDLTVPAGAILGFLGPNGAGKTTTMKIVMGLLRPTGGRALVLGHDVSTDGVAARAHIGYLPQQPRFHPYRSCRGVLDYVANVYPGRRRSPRSRIDELLDAVGLTDKADRRAGALSGGEAQRLGLAQALVAEPDLLILDEPAAALDPQGRHDVLGLLDGLRGRSTVFYSTHILDDVQRVSDSVAILQRGQVVAHGPIGELLATPTTTWTARLAGEPSAAHERVAAQPWVASVDRRVRGTQHVWTITVTCAATADEQLLPLLVGDDGCDVVEFHRTDRTLEDAYLDVIGGADA